MKSTKNPLETRVLQSEQGVLELDSHDTFTLARGIDKDELATGGPFTVDVIAPWKSVYNISRHNTQVDAQTQFELYDNKIKNAGYKVRIISPNKAEIVDPR